MLIILQILPGSQYLFNYLDPPSNVILAVFTGSCKPSGPDCPIVPPALAAAGAAPPAFALVAWAASAKVAGVAAGGGAGGAGTFTAGVFVALLNNPGTPVKSGLIEDPINFLLFISVTLNYHSRILFLISRFKFLSH